MSEEPYLRLPKFSQFSLWILVWGAVWFVLLNAVIGIIFDWKFFDVVDFDRLMMQPSDNELQSMIDKVRAEDKKHLILLGDSIVWGIGIQNPENSIAGRLGEYFADREEWRVTNLSVPGNSFFDAAAIIRDSYDEKNVYVFFVNPMLFREYYASRDFEGTVRFKELVKRIFREHTELFQRCCDLDIPSDHSDMALWLQRMVFRMIPLYHDRDLLTKTFVGLHPSIAVDALLNRVRTFSPSLFARKPMLVEGAPGTPKEVIDFSESRMFPVLREVTELLQEKDNVFYVILDDNMFAKTKTQDRNVTKILTAISSERILNLYRKIPVEHFLDAVHMKPSGHALVAGSVFQFLSQHDAL